MADSEITRIIKASPPTDLLVAALRRGEKMLKKEHKLKRLIAAYRYVLPDEAGKDAVRLSYSRVSIATKRPLSVAELFVLKAEIERYLDIQDALNELLGLEVASERDRAALFRQIVAPTKLGKWIRDWDLIRDPDAEMPTVAKLSQHLDRCLRQLESLVNTTTPGEQTIVGNVSSGRRSKWNARSAHDTLRRPRTETRRCYACGKPGHLAKDCKIADKSQGAVKNAENVKESVRVKPPPSISPWNRSSMTGAVISSALCAMTKDTKYVFDTGAAVVSYVPSLEGMDRRTMRELDTPHRICGVGGDAQARYGGTVYLALGEGQDGLPVAVRFDALLLERHTDVLSKVGLVSSFSLVYDGGLHCFKSCTTQPYGLIEDITICRDAEIYLGAVGAKSDPERSIKVRLNFDQDTFLYTLPVVRALTQEEIEALVPEAPESLTVASDLLKLTSSVGVAVGNNADASPELTPNPRLDTSEEHESNHDNDNDEDAQAAFVELHFRLGHRHPKEMKRICPAKDWRKEFDPLMVDFNCEVCARRRMRRSDRPPPRFVPRAQTACARLFLDTIPVPEWTTLEEPSDAVQICSPFSITLANRFHMTKTKTIFTCLHMLVLVDEFSKSIFTYPLEDKQSKTIKFAIEHFITVDLPLIRDQRSHSDSLYHEEDPYAVRMLTLHTDKGSEFDGHFGEICNDLGLCRSEAPAGEQFKNGTVEGRIRELKGLIRTYFDTHHRCTPMDFAMYATFAASQLNMLPTRSLGASPYFTLFGRAPPIEWLRDFGSVAYVYNPDDPLVRGRKAYLRAIKFGNPARGMEFVFADTKKSTVVHDAKFIPMWVQTVKPRSSSPDVEPDVALQHPTESHARDATEDQQPPQALGDEDHHTTRESITDFEPEMDLASEDTDDEKFEGHPSIDGTTTSSPVDDPILDDPSAQASDVVPAAPPQPLRGPTEANERLLPLEGANSEGENLRIEREEDDLGTNQNIYTILDDTRLGLQFENDSNARQQSEQTVEEEKETNNGTRGDVTSQADEPGNLRRSSRTPKPPERLIAGIATNTWGNVHGDVIQFLDNDDDDGDNRDIASHSTVFFTSSSSLPSSLLYDQSGMVAKWISQSKERLTILDLCSGSSSIQRALVEAHVDHMFRVITVDTDNRVHPTLQMSVVDLAERLKSRNEPPELRGVDIHFIWASPPCTSFSAANTGRDPEVMEREMVHANLSCKLVSKSYGITRTRRTSRFTGP